MMGHIQALAQSKSVHRSDLQNYTDEVRRKRTSTKQDIINRRGGKRRKLKTQANVPEGCALFYKKKEDSTQYTAGQAVRREGSYWKEEVRKSQTRGEECY